MPTMMDWWLKKPLKIYDVSKNQEKPFFLVVVSSVPTFLFFLARGGVVLLVEGAILTNTNGSVCVFPTRVAQLWFWSCKCFACPPFFHRFFLLSPTISNKRYELLMNFKHMYIFQNVYFYLPCPSLLIVFERKYPFLYR